MTLLSDWGKTPRAVEADIDPSVDMKTPPLLQVNNIPAKDYFTHAAELMKQHPPHRSDGSILLRRERIGLEPGRSFDLDSLPPELQKAVEEGAKQALTTMRAMATSERNAQNGWVTVTS